VPFLRVVAWFSAQKFSVNKFDPILTSGADSDIIGTNQEKSLFYKGFERSSPNQKSEKSTDFRVSRESEKYGWLLGYSWIDPHDRVEKSNWR
jgi:hypothetical protein